MKELMHLIRENTVWLHYPLFEYGLFYIDLWSLAHLWSGAILFAGLTAFGWKNRWRWLFFFLFAFELIEAIIFISVLKLFQPEKLPDCFTDIFIGLTGGYIVYLIFEKWKMPDLWPRLFLYLLSSCAISFFWSGNYEYVLNKQDVNNSGINWMNFLSWMVAGMLILYIYDKGKITSKIKAFALTWIVYLVSIVVITNFTSNLLYAKEVTDLPKSHFLPFIPGDALKTFFYLTAPFFFIVLHLLLDSLFRGYALKLSRYDEK